MVAQNGAVGWQSSTTTRHTTGCHHDKAHIDYLAANSAKIRLGGGLGPGPGEWFCGGLWVLECGSREEAVRLIEDDPEDDPYYCLGLRTGYRLLVWGKAPVYGDVVL
jgi:hypothetical protein